MAGHDANQLARIVPAGMIFIRCKEGRSHCPEEEQHRGYLSGSRRAVGVGKTPG